MEKRFVEVGDFCAMYAAEAWCRDHGISVGRNQRGAPRGLLIGDFDIQKWRNLRPEERTALHGRMTGNMRDGPVVISLDRNFLESK
jgi:hypothetical protein